MRGLFCRPTTSGGVVMSTGTLPTPRAQLLYSVGQPMMDCSARSSHVIPCPSSLAPPRPSIMPSPMTAAPATSSPADQRFAGMTRDALRIRVLLLRDRSAQPRLQIVIPRVARAEQDDALVDQQGNSSPQFQGPGEKRIVPPAGFQFDGLPGLAAIHSLLDPVGIGLIFVGFGEGRALGIESGREHGAGCRNPGFGHPAGILAIGAGERDGNEKGEEWGSHNQPPAALISSASNSSIRR